MNFSTHVLIVRPTRMKVHSGVHVMCDVWPRRECFGYIPVPHIQHLLLATDFITAGVVWTCRAALRVELCRKNTKRVYYTHIYTCHRRIVERGVSVAARRQPTDQTKMHEHTVAVHCTHVNTHVASTESRDIANTRATHIQVVITTYALYLWNQRIHPPVGIVCSRRAVRCVRVCLYCSRSCSEQQQVYSSVEINCICIVATKCANSRRRSIIFCLCDKP